MSCLFPLIDRVYNAISSNAQFELSFGHALTESLWGFCSSWALIIHILVMKKKKCIHIREHASLTKVAVDTDLIYTTYTEGSTNARTKYSIPDESYIDNEQ